MGQLGQEQQDPKTCVQRPGTPHPAPRRAIVTGTALLGEDLPQSIKLPGLGNGVGILQKAGKEVSPLSLPPHPSSKEACAFLRPNTQCLATPQRRVNTGIMPLGCKPQHSSTAHPQHTALEHTQIHTTAAPGTITQLPLQDSRTDELVWEKAASILSYVLSLGPRKLDLVILSPPPALKVSISFLHFKPKM